MDSKAIYVSGTTLVCTFTAIDSAGAGIDSLTTKFSILDRDSSLYWNVGETAFDSASEVLHTADVSASKSALGLYEYILTGAVALGGSIFQIHIESTLSVTGDIADFSVANNNVLELSSPLGIADAVWDEVLTGATHNINNSSGKRLRQLGGIIFADGTAQSGGTNTLQLAAGDVSLDGQFQRARLIISSGLGQGQEAIITDSVASTDTLTVTPAWLVTPDNTSEYEIIPGQVHATVRNGGYDNGVFINTITGTAGTQKGVNGTNTHPSDNITDTLAIALTENITQIQVANESDIALVADTKGVSMMGVVWVLRLGGQDIAGSNFVGAQITGTGSSSGFIPTILSGCAISGTCSMPSFVGDCCAFIGTFTMLAATTYTLTNSVGAGVANPIGVAIFAATSSFNLRDFNGAVEIQTMIAGNTMVFDGKGKLVINANCTGGAITVRGNVEIVGADAFIAAGGTINDTANISEILTGIITAKVNAVPGNATTLLIKEISNDAAADLNIADLLKNRVVTFISGVCKGQSVGISAQAASASDPITLTTTTMANFANIAADDEILIT